MKQKDCKYELIDGVYYMLCDGKRIPVDIDAPPEFKAELDYAIKKIARKNEIEDWKTQKVPQDWEILATDWSKWKREIGKNEELKASLGEGKNDNEKYLSTIQKAQEIVDVFRRGADNEHDVSEVTGFPSWSCKLVLDISEEIGILS